jgi:chromosome segregation ATPase
MTDEIYMEALCWQRDRLAAELKRVREQLHEVDGACDLAMKHRDAAEAERDRLAAENEKLRDLQRERDRLANENERLRALLGAACEALARKS